MDIVNTLKIKYWCIRFIVEFFSMFIYFDLTILKNLEETHEIKKINYIFYFFRKWSTCDLNTCLNKLQLVWCRKLFEYSYERYYCESIILNCYLFFEPYYILLCHIFDFCFMHELTALVKLFALWEICLKLRQILIRLVTI